MTISITVTAANQAEYKEALRVLTEGVGLTAKAAPAAKAAPEAKAAAPAPSKAPAAQAAAPAPAPVQTPAAAKEAPAQKAVTVSELLAAGRKLACAGKMEQFGAILNKYNASRISEIPEESWTAALAEMEAAIND